MRSGVKEEIKSKGSGVLKEVRKVGRKEGRKEGRVNGGKREKRGIINDR